MKTTSSQGLQEQGVSQPPLLNTTQRNLMHVRSQSTGASAVYPYSKALAHRYTKKDAYGEPYEVFLKKGDTLLLPRRLCLWGTDDRTEGDPVCFPDTELHPRDAEQKRLIDESVALFKADDSHILEAGTGTGKSFIALAVAQQLGLKTLIVVPKEDIMTQWSRAIQQFLGLKPSQIGKIQQNICDIKGKSIVLAMVHSLAKDKYPSSIKTAFGFTVFDEVHIMGSKEFSKAAGMFASKYRLGLTATPNRRDGKSILFKGHIGDIKVKSTRLMLIPTVLSVTTQFQLPTVVKTIRSAITGEVKRVRVPMAVSAGKTMHVNKMLAGNHPRNLIIARFVASAYAKGRATIVFSDLREAHLDKLHSLFRFHGIPESDISYYVGGMTAAARDRAARRKVILATYKMCSMATDIPWLDTCVLGTPRSDVVQIVGRILREDPNKKDPVVFDIVDRSVELFAGYYRSRVGWYKKIGASVLTRRG